MHSTRQTTQTTTSTMNPVPSITAAIASAINHAYVYTQTRHWLLVCRYLCHTTNTSREYREQKFADTARRFREVGGFVRLPMRQSVANTVGPHDLQSWRGRVPRVPWGGRAHGYVGRPHSTMQTTQTTTSTMNPVPSITAIASASYDPLDTLTGSSAPDLSVIQQTRHENYYRQYLASLPTLRPWAPPAERGPFVHELRVITFPINYH